MDNVKHFAIVVAAGKGLRMGLKSKKQYLYLDKIPILTRTLMVFDRCEQVHEILLVIPEEDEKFCKTNIIDPYGFKKKIHLIEGGNQRQDSVLNALKYMGNKSNLHKDTIVMIHDGVRPFVNQNMIKDAIRTASECGACIPAVKITDTIKEVTGGAVIQKTIDRENLYKAQTPQTFKLDLILRAVEHAVKTSFKGTDDASLVENMGHKVNIIQGSELNIKLTVPEDLVLGKHLLTFCQGIS